MVYQVSYLSWYIKIDDMVYQVSYLCIYKVVILEEATYHAEKVQKTNLIGYLRSHEITSRERSKSALRSRFKKSSA